MTTNTVACDELPRCEMSCVSADEASQLGLEDANSMLGDRFHDYYLETELRFGEAQRLLKRMTTTGNGTEAKAVFIGFLELTKTLFFPLMRYRGDLPGFNDWWRKQRAALEQDAIAKFFWKQRNEVVKAANELLYVKTIKANAGGYRIPGPNLTYQALHFVTHPTSQRWVPFSDDLNATLTLDFRQKPTNDDAIVLCEKYMATLDGVIEDFVRTFPGIQVANTSADMRSKSQ